MTDLARAIEDGRYREIQPPQGLAAQLFTLEAIPLSVAPAQYAHLLPVRESPWAPSWYAERALRMARLGYLQQAQELLETSGAGEGGQRATAGTLATLADKIKDYCLVREALTGRGHTSDPASAGGCGDGETAWEDISDILPPFREQVDLIKVLDEVPAERRRQIAPELALQLRTIRAADRCRLWSWTTGGSDTALLPVLQQRAASPASLEEELLALRPAPALLKARIGRAMRLIAVAREASSAETALPLTPSAYQELCRYREFGDGLGGLERFCVEELGRMSLEEGEHYNDQ